MSDTNVHRVVGNLLVGTSHFFVDTTTNRVGVNTSSPSASLDIASGDLKVGSGITLASGGTITATAFDGDGSLLQNINSDSGSWVNGTNSNVHLATSTDKVGIGTSDPQRLLHLKRTGAATFQRIQNVNNNNGCGIELMRGDTDTWGATAWSDWRINNTEHLDFGVKFTGTDIPSVLHLHTTGNVGINQTSPYAKLDVNGFVKGGPGVTSRAPLHISDNTLDSDSGVGNGKARFMMVHTPQDQYHGNEYGLEIGVSGTGNSLLQSITYTHSTGTTSANYNLGLQPFGGNVGVGTFAPVSLLAISKPLTVPPANWAVGYHETEKGICIMSDVSSFAYGGYTYGAFGKVTPVPAAKIWFTPVSYAAVGSPHAGTHGNLNFGVGHTDSAASTPRMSIGSTGRVGIGTQQPTEILDIVGNLKINGETMSKPPRVIHIDDTRSGCPPMWGAGLNIMFHTFTLSRTAYVYVSVTTILVYSTRADCHIYFGNSKMQSHLTASDNTSWNPVNITAAGSLGAGTHTVSFRCDVANVVGCQGDWGGMQILIFET